MFFISPRTTVEFYLPLDIGCFLTSPETIADFYPDTWRNPPQFKNELIEIKKVPIDQGLKNPNKFRCSLTPAVNAKNVSFVASMGMEAINWLKDRKHHGSKQFTFQANKRFDFMIQKLSLSSYDNGGKKVQAPKKT